VKESILDGKRILAVDDEPDVLTVLEEEITTACRNCKIDKATTYEAAVEKLKTQQYDLVILDIMGVRGFDLLAFAAGRKLRVAMLTAHALSPESLRRSLEMGAMAYLPKEKLGEIVPFLEDVLTFEYLPGWKRLLMNLSDFFNTRWGKDWKKTDDEFWKEFEEKSKHLIVW